VSPVSRVPQAGHASNSASALLTLMRASCRIAAPVVTAAAADYSLQMSRMAEAQEYRVIERGGPGGRLRLHSNAGDRSSHVVIAGFRGNDWPETLTNPRIDFGDDGASRARSWRLSSEQGTFEFEARTVDRVETRPALYEPLHRRFALSAAERLAVRVLLALLRLPGGARLLRVWHARRRG